jgi:hypothetical protein
LVGSRCEPPLLCPYTRAQQRFQSDI